MASRNLSFFFVALSTLWYFAAPAQAHHTIETGNSKSAAVIYVNNHTPKSEEHAQMIRSAVKDADNLSIGVHAYVLNNDSELQGQIEQIADDGVGLIVIVDPSDMQTLMKIPGLYPDIEFTIIGVNAPLYLTNVRSMQFKDQEGMYIMGVLASLRSQSGAVAFLAKEDTERTRNLAYAFMQGAKRTNPDVRVSQQLGDKIHGASIGSNTALTSLDAKADIMLVLDDVLVENALRDAEKAKHLLITYDYDLTAAHPGVVMTSIIKHYDLAVYHTLRAFARGEWKAGGQSLGMGGSFIDYVLTTSNKNLVPKETIEQLEMNKDFISQGIVQINTLGK